MSPLAASLKKRIRENGPITIAEYMEAALTDPEFGYYMRRDPLGVKGDFITAPEISQIFGELIGLWLAEQWRIMGKPRAMLAEAGPGRGTLMADILRATRMVSGFHEAISICLIETSPVLKQKQWETLAGKHPRIEWCGWDELPDEPLLFIANEFFDALPVRQFVYNISSPLAGEDQGGGYQERKIGVDEKGNFVFLLSLSIAPPPTLPSMFAHIEPARGEGIYEHCQPALDIAALIARHIGAHGGAGLIIDYGYTHGSGNTLQAMKAHKRHDFLKHPGEADLTAHVDFAAFKKAAEDAGAGVFGPKPQGAFLGALGAVPRAVNLCHGASEQLQASIMAGVTRLVSPEQMGDLFKALCIVPKGHPAPEGF